MSSRDHGIATILRATLLAVGLTTAGIFMASAAEPAPSPLDAPMQAAQQALTTETNLYQPWQTLAGALPTGTAPASDAAAVGRFKDGAQQLKETDVPALRKSLQDSLAAEAPFPKAIDALQKQIEASTAATMASGGNSNPTGTTPAAGTSPANGTTSAQPANGATAAAAQPAAGAPLTAKEADKLAADAAKELKKAVENIQSSEPKQRTLETIRNVVNNLTGGGADQVQQTVNDVWTQLKGLAGSNSTQVDSQIQSIIGRLRALAVPPMPASSGENSGSSCALPDAAAEGDAGAGGAGTGEGAGEPPAPATPDPKLPEAKALLKRLTDLKGQVSTAVTAPSGKTTCPMQDTVLGFLDYGADLTKKLNAELKLPSDKVDPAAGEAQVEPYLNHLATLGSLYQRASILKGAEAKLPMYADAAGQAFLGTEGAAKRTALHTDVPACFTKASGCVTTVPSAFNAMQAHTRSQVPVLTKLVQEVRAIQRKQAAKLASDGEPKEKDGKDPAEEEEADDLTVLVKAPEERLKAYQLVGNLKQINDGWQATAAALSGYDEVKTAVSQGNEALLALFAAREVLSGAINLVDETVSGDRRQWVSEQVRLFYFTDVMRLMQSLNPDVKPVNPNDAQFQKEAEALRKQLRSAEAKLFEKRGALSDAKTRLVNLQTELLAANAAAAAASRQADASAEALAALQAKQTTAGTRLTEAQQDPNTPANLLKKLQTAKANLDKAVAAQQKNKEASEEAAKTATDLQTQLQNEQTGLPARIAAAQTEVQELQNKVRRLEAQSAGLALDESDAFANARDHAVFYVAQASAASTDPVRRVEMYAYDDSKTLFLRGTPEDVERVKDIIAGFDRPAPQARVTLWTLQLNTEASPKGSDRMNESFSNIDNSLRHMRGEITHVQDLLRNSVNKEVNRIALQDRAILERKGYHLSERACRYFYYPAEVRRRLGFNPPLPCRFEQMETLQSLRYELDQFTTALQQFSNTDSLEKTIEERARDKKKELTKERIQQLKNTTRKQEAALIARFNALAAMLMEARESLSGDLKPEHECCTCPTHADNHNATDSKCTDPLQESAVVTKKENFDKAIADLLGLNKKASGFVGLSESIRSQSRRLESLPGETSSTKQNGNQLKSGETRIIAVRNATRDLADALISTRCNQAKCASPAIDDLEYLTRWTLPDPSHCTTFGETVFVASLARRSCRVHVLSDFLAALETYYISLNTKDTTQKVVGEDQKKADIRKAAQEASTRFVGSLMKSISDLLPGQAGEKQADIDDQDQGLPRTLPLHIDFPAALFGATNDQNTRLDDGELTANQLEILLAMETKARDAVSSEVKDLIRKIGYQGDKHEGIAGTLRRQYLPLIGWLHSGYVGNGSAGPCTNFTPWSCRGNRAVTPTPSSTCVQPDLKGGKSNQDVSKKQDRAAWEIASLEGDRNSLARATPRVAAADEMIKRLIVVAENDIDEAIVGPHLKTIRELVKANGVHYGTVQRESLLATNRLVARVDPRATAGLEVSTNSTMLDAAMQLGQIMRSVQENKALQASNQDKKAGSNGLIAGGLAKLFGGSTGAALGAGGFLGLLGSMQPDKAEPRGEIYTLGTGSTFKVTPIFDPSGQALRFKFDYVGLTNIREPDGTTDPLIPRVDRHTVNTEVQLSNLELREISRFEATSQLGVPTRKYGGVPFLKDLPVVKEIPILGYFSKQRGRAAVQQESIILGQTTIFPSVSEIVDLLIDVPPSRSLQNRMPGYLKEPTDRKGDGSGESGGKPTDGADGKAAEAARKQATEAQDNARTVVAQSDQASKNADATLADARSQLADTRRRAGTAPDSVTRDQDDIAEKARKLALAKKHAEAAAKRRKKDLDFERTTADEYERAGVEFRAARRERRRDLALVLAEADIRHRRAVEASTASELAARAADGEVEAAQKALDAAKQGSADRASLRALWTAAATAAQTYVDRADRQADLAKQWKAASEGQLQARGAQVDAAQSWLNATKLMESASRKQHLQDAKKSAESAAQTAKTATDTATDLQQRFQAAHQEAEKAHTALLSALDEARAAQAEADKKSSGKSK